MRLLYVGLIVGDRFVQTSFKNRKDDRLNYVLLIKDLFIMSDGILN